MAEFHRALTLKPNYPEAHTNLGSALEMKGNVQEAAQEFHRALELNPDSARPTTSWGWRIFTGISFSLRWRNSAKQ